MNTGQFRVLIVEDEERIGQLIKKLIHWDALGLTFVDHARNGEVAYELICSARPDIVITDIRMPKVNGLDLIEMARERYPQIHFIVLSGYKEFEYAHRALQYEVDGYLLKPINETELNNALQKIRDRILESGRAQKEREQLQADAQTSRQIIKRDFLRGIIEQEEMDPHPKVELTGAIFRGIDIKLDRPERSANRREDQTITEQVTAIVEGLLEGQVEEVLICEKDYLHIYCLFNYNAAKGKEIKGCIGEMLSRLKSYLLKYEPYEVTIGVGGERSSFSEIRFSIQEATRAVGNRLRQGTGRLIYAESLTDLSSYVSPVEGRTEQLITCINDLYVEGLSACIREIYDGFLSNPQADYSGCYLIAGELTDLFFAHIDGEREALEQERKAIWRLCQHCSNVKSLRQGVLDSLCQALDTYRQAAQNESGRPIRLAKAYVEEHYREKVSLEDVAQVVGLNPVYLSGLFKKETDMNFSAYLTQVRMEKAKALLCDTNETVAAVADLVGYKDSRYFSQTFTKVVGIKPALYRKLHA